MSKRHIARWDARTAAAANARRELPRLVAAYFARVRELLADNPPPAKLHAIRLETKRMRYTLELFRPCYGPGMDTRLAALRHIQQLLGEVNDCSTTERYIGSPGPGCPTDDKTDRLSHIQGLPAGWRARVAGEVTGPPEFLAGSVKNVGPGGVKDLRLRGGSCGEELRDLDAQG